MCGLYRCTLQESEGTAPAGGWIRRRRRRATGRRRARKRRIELSLNENFCFSDLHRKLRGAFVFWDAGERERGLAFSVDLDG